MNRKYNIKLPPNTLTNADGTPYQAGHDRAIDEQKLTRHYQARAYADNLYDDLCSKNYIDDGEWDRNRRAEFRGFLTERIEMMLEAHDTLSQ